ncbi:MAG: EF-hand domain-containing protein [Alphaproteobacteria bacterium]|nr:EF-hand domain-containing protein [Alphaproteobacteria bacterium]
MTHDELFELTARTTHDMRVAFDTFDTNGDGRIDADELSSALADLGQPAGPVEVRQLIASVTEEGDTLDFDAFVHLLEPLPEGLDPEAEWREAFRVLDLDGDGYLTPDELAGGEGGLGDAEARRIVAAADVDGDGRISYAEFRLAMRAA